MTDTTITTEAPPSGVQRDSTGTIVDQAKPLTTTESTVKDTSTIEVKPEVKPEVKAEAGAVPEKYEGFTLAEGYELDQTAIDKATPIFKDLKLDQPGAQKLVDLFFDLSKGKNESVVNEMIETRKGWRGEIQKTFGSAAETVQRDIVSVIDAQLGVGEGSLGQEFRKAMDLTGAGDHPAVVKALNKLIEPFKKATTVKGNNPSPLGQQSPDAKPRSAAQAMYPHLPSADSAA